jgi:hypothetical protein
MTRTELLLYARVIQSFPYGLAFFGGELEPFGDR